MPIDPETVDRWRAEPWTFIETALADPATGAAYKLLPAERDFLAHAFKVGDDGRLRYPEQVFSAPKKSGKTAFAAMHLLTLTLLHGGRYPEAVVVANDLEQAQGRVFEAVRKIVECSPWLRRQAKITNDKVTFPDIGATIRAIASDYAGAAGGNQNVAAFDELWAYTSERSRRLWDEMLPPPTRKIACRLVTTYAGFEGESELLQSLYQRGLAQPLVGKDLRAGDGLLFFWTHELIAPWQTETWIEESRRSLRPNQFLRMIENRWTSTEEVFINMARWDACVDPGMAPLLGDDDLEVYVGVDASLKRDQTAIVAVAHDKPAQKVRLVAHKVFQPSPDNPLDFEATVERTIRDLCARFAVRDVAYDPWQMAAVAQRLAASGTPMREFPQTIPNLTAMGSNLYELIEARSLAVYPDAGMRLAVSRAVAIEGSRGWRISKEKAAHKIDLVVALAMASLAAIRGEGRPIDPMRDYPGWFRYTLSPGGDTPERLARAEAERRANRARRLGERLRPAREMDTNPYSTPCTLSLEQLGAGKDFVDPRNNRTGPFGPGQTWRE